MLDFIVRTLARMLSLSTPHPRGRHRLGALPPLRINPIPPPPPRFTELLDGNASRLVRPYALNPVEHHHPAQLAAFDTSTGPTHTSDARVPAATR
ncbi:hypothetical protein KEF29_37260 [Streptomyces tuirus]|uniref:Uncharacterized protein n=1 Tax=Streptomyces tuirus TaxID=68278 RepID=A0A941FE89_9ACTN|nr:hypothetical protein [Streptomyces tuirus]